MDTTSFNSSPSVLTPSASTSATSRPVSTTAPPSSNDFQYPPQYTFPPFFTLQPNLTTLSRQLALWSTLIQSYCAHNRIYRLSLSSAASTPLFHNTTLNKRLDILSIRRVLDYMISAEGDRRAEYVTTSSTTKRSKDTSTDSAWIYWRRPEEWADAIYAWVDGTGQKGSVLTVYELRESDAVQSQAWVGMDEDMFRRCLDVLVKRGRAQVFGDHEGAGVKFF